MHNKLLAVFSKLEQKTLGQLRKYYDRPMVTAGWAGELSDAEFATMLNEIDSFSVQFSLSRGSKRI